MNTPAAMRIEITNQQDALPIDADRLERVCRRILADADYTAAELSIAVIDDPTMHELNRRHLDHDYPTDVLSFPLEDDGRTLQGEVIVSADTAIERAEEFRWAPEHELLLYVIHGLLHLVGYGDKSDAEAAEMRRAERRYLELAGIEPPVSPSAGGQVG